MRTNLFVAVCRHIKGVDLDSHTDIKSDDDELYSYDDFSDSVYHKNGEVRFVPWIPS